jgi:hypothetical protein
MKIIITERQYALFSKSLNEQSPRLFTPSTPSDKPTSDYLGKNAAFEKNQYKGAEQSKYYDIERAKELDACKSKYNSYLLKKATDWWKNWLKSKSTQQRFANTFGYGLGYVEQIFFQYGKILDQIKMEYVFDKTTPNAGWVQPLWKSGYDIPIKINCPSAMNYNYQNLEIETFFIHEIQHVLSSYHRFEHPLQDNFFKDFFNFYKDLLTGGLKSEPEETEFKLDRNSTSYKTLYKFLTSQGFKDDTIDDLLYRYFWRLRYDEEHLKERNEIRSSLAELRRVLKLNPNQKITKELLINNALEDGVEIFIHQWLFSGQPLSEFLNYYNSLAMGNPNTTDKNLA